MASKNTDDQPNSVSSSMLESGLVSPLHSRVDLSEGAVSAEFVRDARRQSLSSASASASARVAPMPPSLKSENDSLLMQASGPEAADETTRLLVRSRRSSLVDSPSRHSTHETSNSENVEFSSRNAQLPVDNSLTS